MMRIAQPVCRPSGTSTKPWPIVSFAGLTTKVSFSCVPRSLLPVFSFMEEISDRRDLLEKRASVDKIHPTATIAFSIFATHVSV
jgi:hypothetical protein